MKKKTTLRRKAHLLTAQNREKALNRGIPGLLSWNWKLGVVAYGFMTYTLLVRLLTGRVGFYLIWDLIGDKVDYETTMDTEG